MAMGNAAPPGSFLVRWRLELGGQPYRFYGINIYNANNGYSDGSARWASGARS